MEGVNGSSPSEGSKIPAKRLLNKASNNPGSCDSLKTGFFVVRTARIEHLLEKEGSETSDVRQHALELA
jgi:hypothetical protein